MVAVVFLSPPGIADLACSYTGSKNTPEAFFDRRASSYL